MGRKKMQLIIDFQSRNLYSCENLECFFCQTDYPIPPVVVTMTETLANGDIPETCNCMCSACILSDTKTLAATARATVKRNRAKRKEIQAKAEADRTEYEQGFVKGDEDYSSDITMIANILDRLGDVSKIINHDLAVAIAKHYTEKAA